MAASKNSLSPFSALAPSRMYMVASPPSSKIRLRASKLKILSAYSQYSSKVSPLTAKTGIPLSAIAAAA